jgi:hypothetical protein
MKLARILKRINKVWILIFLLFLVLHVTQKLSEEDIINDSSVKYSLNYDNSVATTMRSKGILFTHYGNIFTADTNVVDRKLRLLYSTVHGLYHMVREENCIAMK